MKYSEKFAELIDQLGKMNCGDVLMIAIPEALGDNYEEVIESLNRIADAEVQLSIVPRLRRDPPHVNN